MSDKKNAPLFSIVIPTWNNLEYLKLLIESIRKNSTYQHQLIVYVNEGKDGTLDWVKKQKDLAYVYSSENQGICVALNESRKKVNTDYLLYLNDDMYVCPGWDEALFKVIDNIGHQRFFISATMIEPLDTGNPCVIVQDCGQTVETFNEEQLLSNFMTPGFRSWYGSSWPPNIVPVSLWDEVGGYSLEFSPGMYSDPDFSRKLWEASVRCFFGVADSRVYHFGKRSTKRLAKNKGKLIFQKKWNISPGDFYKYYLRMGQEKNGDLLQEVNLPLWVKLKNYFK